MVRAGRLTGKIIHRDISSTRSSTAPLKKSTSFAFASLSPSAHQCAFILVAWPQTGISKILYLWQKRNNLYHDNNNSMMAFCIWFCITQTCLGFCIILYTSFYFYTLINICIIYFSICLSIFNSQCISVILSILFSVPVETTKHFNACKYCSEPDWCVLLVNLTARVALKACRRISFW